MDISTLERFAQSSRRRLIEQVSTKLQLVISEGSAARRENPDAIRNLEKQIAKQGEQQVIEKNAYIWFNRLCALRFMDANGYTRIAVVSPAPDKSQPEILVEAKSGYFDDSLTPKDTQNEVISFINRSSPSNDPESEAYRLLIVAACNYYHKAMPYLFTHISDFTELLMPDNLLLRGSVMRNALEVMTDESCKEVEIIGWLYQYYISEKKDEVFADLKKNKKITPENIPAATQLFTPHWIVRYLTENSLGRLWLLNNPESKLIEQMDYYIKPEKNEEDYLHISSPEELKICDPACGSGHMLTYAFDLLYAIYDEKGYDPSEIPEKILTHNLFGIEIDERARELSAFALTMKARGKQRRFFQKKIQPNICALKNIHFDEDEREEYTKFIGRDLFTDAFIDTLSQFEETDNFGSLIQPKLKDAHEILEVLKNKDLSGQLFLSGTHDKVLRVLKQADYLSPKYHVVVANPPYMGRRGMNQELSAWSMENYPDSKSDLFAMFMERTLKLTVKDGFMGMITQQSWMFLKSYEELRKKIIKRNKIDTMAHLGARAFDSISGEVVQVTAFTLIKSSHTKQSGIYCRLIDFNSSSKKDQEFFNIENRYEAKQENFEKISGSLIAYWASERVNYIYKNNKKLYDYADAKVGLQTGDNDRFRRNWQEINFSSLANIDIYGKKWFPYNSGGAPRKWYGNQYYVVNWKNDGSEIRNFPKSVARNSHFYLKSCISWSKVSSDLALRYFPKNFIFDVAGCSIFSKLDTDKYIMSAINSPIKEPLINSLSPTINFEVGQLSNFPIIFPKLDETRQQIETLTQQNIDISKEEWDSRETSWDFTKNELIKYKFDSNLETAYTNYCDYWSREHNTLHQNEEELNRLFIGIYELEDELTPEVDLKDITILKNEAKIDDDELVFQANEIMKQFISYAVGCMFGRYSLDQPGLILANQGESIDQYLDQVPNPSFMPDDDNVIPLLDGNWFTDDIVDRFYNFVRTTFGRDHYDQNIDFIKQSIGKDIRNYFLKDFYSDHIKRYNKRPIYWMLSTPNASFNVLIYMHRYQTDTLSIILNDYLRSYKAKLAESKKQKEAISISPGSNEREKIKALSEIEDISKILRELDTYEHEVIYPLANDQVEIDLDDGVKVNYNKFGEALKKVSGLSGK